MSETEPKFEYVLDGVIVSVEATDLTYSQAFEMMVRAYPERRLDIISGLRQATGVPLLTNEAAPFDFSDLPPAA